MPNTVSAFEIWLKCLIWKVIKDSGSIYCFKKIINSDTSPFMIEAPHKHSIVYNSRVHLNCKNE